MRLLTQLLGASFGIVLAALLPALASNAAGSVAIFKGAVFIDSAGAPVGTKVEALVGSTVCAEVKTVPSPVDTGFASIYNLAVLSATDKSGCGTEGARVTFRVNGRPANGSVEWHAAPAVSLTDLVPDYPAFDLVVGPPVFVLAGYVKGANPPSGSSIRAFVGNTNCGSGEILPKEPEGDAWYRIIVKSDGAAKGCARAGSEIRLVINDQEALEKIVADPKTRQADITLPLRSPPVNLEPESGKHSGTWIVLLAGTGTVAASLLGALLLLKLRRSNLET
jgi:hypothetical protein